MKRDSNTELKTFLQSIPDKVYLKSLKAYLLRYGYQYVNKGKVIEYLTLKGINPNSIEFIK